MKVRPEIGTGIVGDPWDGRALAPAIGATAGVAMRGALTCARGIVDNRHRSGPA
jgi:hypothetical protein